MVRSLSTLAAEKVYAKNWIASRREGLTKSVGGAL